MRAAIYARKSTEQTVADEAKSVTRQGEQARAFAEKNGWTVDDAHVYVDDAISGASFDRPGLTALLAAVAGKPRPFDVLVVMSTDRLGREMSETMQLQLKIVRAGVRIFFYQSGAELLLGTSTDKLKATIDNFGAEQYREKVRDNVREAMREKAKKGHSTGGNVLGYDRREVVNTAGERSHVERVVNPEQAEIVRRIFQLAADGLGFQRIAKRLNYEGVVNPFGRLTVSGTEKNPRRKPSALWSPTGIRQVLKRKLYIGIVEYNQSRFADPVRDEHGRERKLKVVRPESEWTITPAPALRIVSDDLWSAAQARIERTKGAYIRRRGTGQLMGKPESGLASKVLLAGFVKCSVCGGNLVRVGRDGRFIFVCSEHHRRGSAGCIGKYTVGADVLTQAVVGRLKRIFTHPAAQAGMLEEAERLHKKPDDAAEQIEALASTVDRLDGELARLAEAIAAGGAVPAVLAALKAKQGQRDAAAGELARLEGLDRQPGFDRADWAEFFQMIGRQLDQVFQLEPAAGRQVLRRLLGGAALVVKIEAGGVFHLAGTAQLSAVAELVLSGLSSTGEPAAWRL
jgi:site-specific DNA recombinase